MYWIPENPHWCQEEQQLLKNHEALKSNFYTHYFENMIPHFSFMLYSKEKVLGAETFYALLNTLPAFYLSQSETSSLC